MAFGPIGSVSGTRLDLDPWAQSVQAFLQAERMRADERQAMADRDMRARQNEQAVEMQLAELDQRRQLSAQDFGLRQRQQDFEQETGRARTGLAEREQVLNEKRQAEQARISEEDLMLRKGASARDDARLKLDESEFKAKSDRDKAKTDRDETMRRVATELRPSIESTGESLLWSNHSLDQARASLLNTFVTQNPGLSVDEKLAAEAAIDQWYGRQMESSQRSDDAANRDFNKAIRTQQTELMRQKAKTDAIAKDPTVRSANREIENLKNRLADAEFSAKQFGASKTPTGEAQAQAMKDLAAELELKLRLAYDRVTAAEDAAGSRYDRLGSAK
jgi:hypothetical protein